MGRIIGANITKINFDKEDKVGGISLPDFKAYCTATVMEMVWYWWDILINGTEENQETISSMPNWFLTKVQKQYKRGKMAF